MDRYGSKMTYDVAFTQTLSRHRNLMALDENKPIVEYSWIASNSTLVGSVYVGSYASIWYNAVLRAEYAPIRVGSYSSIGDGCILHTHGATPTGVPPSINIGKNVTIQNKCIIYSSIIDDDVFIGAGSVIGVGSKIEKGAVIAPGSLVPPGRSIPGGQLWAGNPVKLIRDLTEEESFSNYTESFNMWNLAQTHLDQFKSGIKDEEIDPNS